MTEAAQSALARMLLDPAAPGSGEDPFATLTDEAVATTVAATLPVSVRRFLGDIDRVEARRLATARPWADPEGAEIPAWLVEAVLRTGVGESDLLGQVPPVEVVEVMAAVMLNLSARPAVEDRDLEQAVAEVVVLARGLEEQLTATRQTGAER